MVNRLTRMLLLMLTLVAASPMVYAELTVNPDRTRLYEGETLTLTVQGSMKIEINLDNLFDLGNANLPSPDIEKLEPNFEIVGQNQRYSIRTVNNEMRGEITWTYQLLPRKTGKLEIPALTFKGDKSQPVSIDVVKGSPPGEQTSSRDAFIELSTDKDELYVQEQLVFTVKLFFRGNLIRGDLSTPEHADAIIEPLGKQREYTASVGDQRYRVVERRYAIYPQNPGNLELDAVHFEGQARDAAGQLQFLRDSKRLFDIPVKPVPDQFTGDTWLPASNLTLSASGLESLTEIQAGQSLARTLTLTAEGLPPSALPSLPEAMPDGMRAYPEPEQRDSRIDRDGITSTLNQVSALVPLRPGTLTLPEVRIHWWDTDTDAQKTATIPARTLQVGAGTISENPVGGTPVTETDDAATSTTKADSASPWLWISLALAAGWALSITGVIWWVKTRGPDAAATPGTQDDPNEASLFRELTTAADRGQPSALHLLPRWVAARYPGAGVHSAVEAAQFTGDGELEAEIRQLHDHLYRSKTGRQTPSWDGRALVNALKRVRNSGSRPVRSSNHLPPLYPDGFHTAG